MGKTETNKQIITHRILDATILNADVNADAAIARSKLAEDTVQTYGIPLQTLKNDDGTSLAAAAAAGKFGISSGGLGTGTLTLDGEAASGASKTSTAMFEFVLPPEYVSGGDVNLVVTAFESVGAATVATTFSCEAYESTKEGAVGSNLAGAPDVTDITPSWQTSTTAITATGLVAGDRLTVFIRLVSDDAGGAIGTIHQIGAVYLTVDIKG